MSLRVVLDPGAREEFDDGYGYYERRRSGKGEEFADAVQMVLDRISLTPRMHQSVFGSVRRGWFAVSRIAFITAKKRPAFASFQSFTRAATRPSGRPASEASASQENFRRNPLLHQISPRHPRITSCPPDWSLPTTLLGRSGFTSPTASHTSVSRD